MHWKHALLASSAVLAATLGATSVQAQARQGNAAAAAAATNTIEELVVTAEKRAQSLQDVPVAVSAFTSERRDLIGITTIADMTNFTPGLEYNAQNDRNTLRGVGRNTNVHAAEGSVAQYSDGVYTSSTVEAGKTPLFVDRVEILRGPQGTLYGRNSIGGAINIISRKPTEDWYAEVRGQYQNYNHSIIEAAASGPTMIPGVQFRVGVNWEHQSDGWFKNVIPGQPDEGNIIDTKYWEAQLQFHFNDKFSGWIKYAGADWHNEGGGPGSRNTYYKTTYNSPAANNVNTAALINAFTSNPALAGSTNLPGAPNFPVYLAGSGAIATTSGYACLNPALTGVRNVVTAGNVPLSVACRQAGQDDPRKITSDVPYQVKLTATTIFASEWKYELTDNMELKYIAGGTHYHYHLGGPTPVNQAPITQYQLPFVSAATGPIPGAGAVVNPRYWFSYEEKENWYSHELNLASTGTSALQWIVGLYYYNEDYTQPVSTTLLDAKAPITNGPFLAPTCPFSDPGTAASGHSVCPNLAGNNRVYDNRPGLNIKSKAVFGQIDWAFMDHWKLTVGLRYTEDEKHGQEQLRLLCVDVPACGVSPEAIANNFIIDLTQTPSVVSGYPGSPIGGGAGTAGVDGNTTVDPATGFALRKYSNKWSATTGTAGIQWTPDSDTNAYFRYSRGYKDGGFRIGIDTVIGAKPNTNAEHSDDFEVGIKKSFGRNFQANLALFYETYENAQIPLTIAATSGGLTQAQSIFYNIPKALTQGVELETIWQPIDHLQIIANYSYLDAHITKSNDAVDPADPAALDPAAKPLLSAAECAVIVVAPSTTRCTADVFSVGLPNGGFQRPQNLKDQNLPNAPKNKIALNVNYTWVLSAGSLTPSITYVWRDEQYGSIFNRSYYRSPAYDQIDLRVTWKGENNRYAVVGFIRNVADSLGYEGGAGAGRNAGNVPQRVLGLPGSLTATAPVVQGITSSYTLTPPRTYGVEVQYKFF